MRVTIIRESNHVYLDGIAYNVDCSHLDTTFHAMQWYDTWGDIEIKDAKGRHVQNQEISEIPTQFLPLIEAAQAEKVRLASLPPPAKVPTIPTGTVNVVKD